MIERAIFITVLLLLNNSLQSSNNIQKFKLFADGAWGIYLEFHHELLAKTILKHRKINAWNINENHHSKGKTKAMQAAKRLVQKHMCHIISLQS